MTRRIVALCSLCGHEYARLFDGAETAGHMAGAHGMYFDPRPLGKEPAAQNAPGHDRMTSRG